MFDVVRKVLALLSRRERIQLGLLFIAVLVMAFLELVGIAAVLPFLSLAADPTQVHHNPWLAWAYDAFGFTSATDLLIALGAVLAAMLLLSNAWMAATLWAQYRFAYGRMHSLSARLLRHYAAQPYVFFLRRNSADLAKNVLDEVEEVTGGVLMPALTLAARAIVALAIIGLLVAFEPALAMLVALVLGAAYGGIYTAVRRMLARIGAERLAANAGRYKAASELFGAIKDVKLLGKEDAFAAAFVAPSSRFARHQATAVILGQLPRFALEAMAFGGVLLIAVYLVLRGGSLQQVIPVLGLYAFAGYRLMPSLQQVFQALTQLRFSQPALDNLHHELTSAHASPSAAPMVAAANNRASDRLTLARRLELDRLTFAYPGAHKPALERVSLAIEANTTIGIMGPTGSGKTTLVDVILGLLRPQAGEIRIDGVPLTDANLRAWQNSLGYVPQHIYLADDSIARNIAFGVAPERIDTAGVERAARLAHIHDFIAEDLPQGYATPVGERGIRLSGGQRQRIGIARALYHKPSLLVLDEATSALDHDTEAAVMEAMERLAGCCTMIVIAHRLSTLRSCSAVYAVDQGHLGGSGTVAALSGRASHPSRSAAAMSIG